MSSELDESKATQLHQEVQDKNNSSVSNDDSQGKTQDGESFVEKKESVEKEAIDSLSIGDSEEVRAELIQTAVEFLSLPKVSESSIQKKRTFLKSKGLTEREISIAFQKVRTKSDPLQCNSFSTVHLSSAIHPPSPYDNNFPDTNDLPSAWSYFRKFTYSAALMSAFCYGSYWLYQKFVEPTVIRYMSEKFGSIEQRLEQLKKAVIDSEEKNNSLQTVVQEYIDKSGASKTEIQALNELKSEITAIKGMLKNSNSSHTGYAIAELKSEISTVKSILLDKVPGVTIPSWQLTNGESPSKLEELSISSETNGSSSFEEVEDSLKIKKKDSDDQPKDVEEINAKSNESSK